MTDLSTTLAGLTMPTPLMTASGCGGTGRELAQFVDLAAVGAFTTRTITLDPLAGSPAPRVADTPGGVLTDTGISTPHIESMLSGCDALTLECNHDLDMLMNGPYVRQLKQRVSGRLGHLDNQSAAALLGRLDNRRLQHIVAAHLSAQNNSPALARQALSTVLDCASDWIGIADQATGFEWREISS